MFALIRFELDKLRQQRKSWVGVLNIVLINVLFALAFIMNNSKRGARHHEFFKDRLVSEFLNAYSYTAIILAPMVYLMFPMVLSVLAGYMLAGEFELGNLRMTLFRPVARWKVLVSKFIALSAYAGLMLAVLGLASYGIACSFLKSSGDVAFPGPLIGLGDQGWILHPAAEMPRRILLSYLLAWPMLMSVAAMALMFAVITRHFTSAAIITSTVYFSSYIVGTIPILSSIHPYLPTSYWPFWNKILSAGTDIPWHTIQLHALWTLAYTLGFLALGAMSFNMRDV